MALLVLRGRGFVNEQRYGGPCAELQKGRRLNWMSGVSCCHSALAVDCLHPHFFHSTHCIETILSVQPMCSISIFTNTVSCWHEFLTCVMFDIDYNREMNLLGWFYNFFLQSFLVIAFTLGKTRLAYGHFYFSAFKI